MDVLIEKIIRTQNPTVLGLDPNWKFIPEESKKKHNLRQGDCIDYACNAILDFNKQLLFSLSEIVPATKLNFAFYEQFGWRGVKVFDETIHLANSLGYYVIADGKRNDIGSTMEASARAYLGETTIDDFKFRAFPANALTVNAYLGSDGIIPATDMCKEYDHDIFVLAKTSNPSSGELQDKYINETSTVYEEVGLMCQEWGKDLIGKYGYSNVGIVVGATYPKQLGDLRQLLPNNLFLVPGYGAQGGKAEDLKCAVDNRGLGILVNSSRGLMCAYQRYPELTFEEATVKEATLMRNDLISVIGKIG